VLCQLSIINYPLPETLFLEGLGKLTLTPNSQPKKNGATHNRQSIRFPRHSLNGDAVEESRSGIRMER
jgi:hypothetical protein